MISQIDEFTAAADAVDEIFSEPLRLMPQAGGSADATRLPHNFAAILRIGDLAVEQMGKSRGWSSRIESGKAQLSISRSTYSGPDLQIGDLIRAPSRAGQPDWEIQTINDRHKTRIVCELGAA